jgi:glyoxylate reductase
LPDLLAASDFVSLHVALTPETRHLIDADALASMKRGAILVNTSRGAVVDTRALIEALSAGRLGAAGLDVYEDEPHVPIELRELPNTVLSPHFGSATGTTREAMARLCAENVIAVLEGREPPAPVV